MHITSPRTYFIVYVGLLLLLAATVGVAYVNLGVLNWIIALVIATIKAGLVIWYFMHVRDSSELTRLYVVGGLVWLAILFGLTLTDYISRAGGL